MVDGSLNVVVFYTLLIESTAQLLIGLAVHGFLVFRPGAEKSPDMWNQGELRIAFR